MMKILVLALALLTFGVQAHPTYYPEVNRNVSCYNPTPAKIYSYHIHMLYIGTNDNQYNDMVRIRQAFKD